MKSPPLLLLAAVLPLSVHADPASVLGYLEPYRSIEMNPSEAGVIGEIHVDEGESVEAGDAILSLNNKVLEAQLGIAEVQAGSDAAIIVATAERDVAKDRFGKLSRLQSSGTAHSSEVARAEAEVKKTEAELQIAEEEKTIAALRVEEIQAQIERRVLRSPIDGVVLDITRDIAESATEPASNGAGKPLVRVARIDRLKLVVHVPAAHVGALQKGGELPVRVLQRSSLSRDRENSAIDTLGTIEFVSPAIDPSSETLRTRLVVENPDGELLSGSHALVLLE